jgi:hypothetical protein
MNQPSQLEPSSRLLHMLLDLRDQQLVQAPRLPALQAPCRSPLGVSAMIAGHNLYPGCAASAMGISETTDPAETVSGGPLQSFPSLAETVSGGPVLHNGLGERGCADAVKGRR